MLLLLISRPRPKEAPIYRVQHLPEISQSVNLPFFASPLNTGLPHPDEMPKDLTPRGLGPRCSQAVPDNAKFLSQILPIMFKSHFLGQYPGNWRNHR